MRRLLDGIYTFLGALACASLFMTFIAITGSVVVRKAGWDVQGLDAYAGYGIAAALFLALPITFQRGEHIRVGLILERASPAWRGRLHRLCLVAGTVIATYLAWFSARLVWMSYATHDISQGIDATPLWIPQIAMAVGATGFAISLFDALVCDLRGTRFFSMSSDDAARSE